ncbi:hypothetical protein [Salinivibrio costicola]|uniref:hypothetical protein n=1 Tax=Salinivibrio costicola TaxID=51367 RepID=UPI000AB52DEF|nr:hypothetical protein [Salinivibrio costicola]
MVTPLHRFRCRYSCIARFTFSPCMAAKPLAGAGKALHFLKSLLACYTLETLKLLNG